MLRLVDANLNRVSEGLRLLEDIARFLLDDAEISRELKSMRHGLVTGDRALVKELLNARRADEDVGAFIEAAGEAERADAVGLVTANARRVQQSLRVLEEFSKLPQAPSTLNSARIKSARFTLYQLERTLVARLLRQEKAARITGLYMIIDTGALGGRSELEIARQAIQGGARVIQLRDKYRTKGELLPVAQGLKKVCAETEALFIVNDHLDLALAADADGLHLGQGDLPVASARRLLPLDKVIGCSAATTEEAVQAQRDGADYIAIGSIYPTSSKGNTRPAGLETLEQVKKAVSVPLVAIGGINRDNVAQVMSAGANAVAVISAVLGAEEAGAAAEHLVATIKDISPGRQS